jgi:magnesium-transporting ATPase (P-type)
MTTIHREFDVEIAFTKGAPREVLHLCTHIQLNNEIVALDNRIRTEIMAANDEYARNALRVLGVARRDLPFKSGPYMPDNIEQQMVFLGLTAMMDPPRPEVETAVRTCRQAGIRIIMITGDYGLTAESLARRVGLLTTPNARIITGAEVEELSDPNLLAISGRGSVRAYGRDKLRLVSLPRLRRGGGRTGDGGMTRRRSARQRRDIHGHHPYGRIKGGGGHHPHKRQLWSHRPGNWEGRDLRQYPANL